MSKTEQSRAAYNKMAKDYDNTREGRFTAAFKRQLVKAVKLNPSDSVLDVACGNGDLLGMIARKWDINGYGVDIAENMIIEAKRLHPQFHFAVSGCDRLPFEDSFFDCLTVSAAFHHFEKPSFFLNEAKRVLKRGGSLFIAELYWDPVFRTIANPFLPLLKSGDVRIYSPKQLEKFLSKNGFTGVQLVRNGHIQIVRGVSI